MLKLLGVGLLLTGGVGLGVSAVRRLAARVTALRSLTEALELMERELEFNLPTMDELIGTTAQRASEPAASFLQACQVEMEGWEGRSVSEIWKQAAYNELSVLKKCDLEALFAVGAVLGRYDAESQRYSMDAARERLAVYLQDAIEEQKRMGRVYGVLGATAGAFLVILLL